MVETRGWLEKRLGAGWKPALPAFDAHRSNLTDHSSSTNLQFHELQFHELQFRELQFRGLQFRGLQFRELQFRELQFRELQYRGLKFHELQYSGLRIHELQFPTWVTRVRLRGRRGGCCGRGSRVGVSASGIPSQNAV